jgi:hypothetical protein
MTLALGPTARGASREGEYFMEVMTDRLRIRLTPRASVRINSGVGYTINCLSGTLWITQHHDSADHLLHGPDSMALTMPGVALATAGEDSLLEIASAGGAGAGTTGGKLEVKIIPALWKSDERISVCE